MSTDGPTLDLKAVPPVRAAAFALLAALTTIPVEETDATKRLTIIRTALKKLSDLRVDGESLVRFGLSRQVGQILIALLVLESGTTRPFTLADQERASKWRDVLHLPAVTAVTSETRFATVLSEQFSRASRPVQKWIENASLSDVVNLDPPTAAELERLIALPDADSATLEQYRWAADRILEADLGRWATTSLHLEFKWQAGTLTMVFSAPVFDELVTDPSRLAMEIAARAVNPGDYEESSPQNDLLYRLQDQARSFLRQGRHMEAAALFEFYGRMKPGEGYADNNRGFCLIPIDPEEALEAFARAKRENFVRRGILAYNSACALLGLGREAEAVDLLEYYWQREREDRQEGCTLWRRRGPEWEMYSELDVRSAICRLASEISADLSNGRAQKWQGRAEDIELAA